MLNQPWVGGQRIKLFFKQRKEICFPLLCPLLLLNRRSPFISYTVANTNKIILEEPTLILPSVSTLHFLNYNSICFGHGQVWPCVIKICIITGCGLSAHSIGQFITHQWPALGLRPADAQLQAKFPKSGTKNERNTNSASSPKPTQSIAGAGWLLTGVKSWDLVITLLSGVMWLRGDRCQGAVFVLRQRLRAHLIWRVEVMLCSAVLIFSLCQHSAHPSLSFTIRWPKLSKALHREGKINCV